MNQQADGVAEMIRQSGLSVYRVARLAGVSRGTLAPALKGTRPMPRAYPEKIRAALVGRIHA